MTPSEQAAAHDANFAGVFATLARSVEHGFAGRVREVPVASLGVPVGFFNAAWPSAGTLPGHGRGGPPSSANTTST